MKRFLTWLIIKRGAEDFVLNPRVSIALLIVILSVLCAPVICYLISPAARIEVDLTQILIYLAGALYVLRLLVVECLAYKPGPMAVIDFASAGDVDNVDP